MQKPYRFTADQYQAAIDAIAIASGGQAGDMPISLGWFKASRREPNRVGNLRKAWPTMSLEDRLGELAVMIGSYVRCAIRGNDSNPRHVITHGYELLCRTGSLFDDPAPAMAA